MKQRLIIALVVGRDVEIEYQDASGEANTVRGKLTSTNESGFISVETPEGKAISVNKDKVHVVKDV